MSSYCNIDNAYNFDENNLDKMAREYNKKTEPKILFDYDLHNTESSNKSKISNNISLGDMETINTSNLDTQTLTSHIEKYMNINKKNKNKNKLRDIVKYIHTDFKHTDEEQSFEHIKKCNKCINRMLSLLNNNKKKDKYNKSENFLQTLCSLQPKELIMLLIVAVFIIIIISIIFKK